MGNNKKQQQDVSDLGISLSSAPAALTDAERAFLEIALKNKLQNLSEEQPFDVPETLTPTVRKRVEALRDIQIKHNEMDAKFFEEIAALEMNYQKQYETLSSKRYEIVNGVVEVDGVNNKPSNDLAADKEEKGVPEFWLTAMKNNKILVRMIYEEDEDALKYLNDIKWCKINDPCCFKLEFFFDANPYFKNSVLTIVYDTLYDISIDHEFLPDNAMGTHIEWLPGKCLTHKSLKKGKNGRQRSFFDLFNPPQFIEDYDSIDPKEAAILHGQLQAHYDICLIIRDTIIPYAFSWFAGGDVQED